ncbi:tRNA lysidine(34) synthetase TilS [Marinobacter salinus]|uniref:tRNA(Ile)-lysidine synthase n=1 Tax=Marinobacter salinus TaxID=1874317 RepID=A0A1D9GKT5_9GAMM|nr:tRNA lysidine(34) synthetase TilS [Marinobacter salinus]AOY88134.1 tRNA lysidine(34) synthetase TilS [Marinobacter salinus]
MTPGAKPGSGFAWPDTLCEPVRSLPSHSRLWVALSGGLDSVLLLHLAAFCHRSRVPLGAIHVNHQLQPNAGEAEAFCREQCGVLGIPFVARRVIVNTGGNDSGAGGVEEAARKARYAVFEQILEPGDLLLMAHHGDDQAETVLFRLLRGSGVAGLAGMPRSRKLGAGHLARPLLDLARDDIVRWAREAGLSWVEDPSNVDQVYDRNYLRHAILPRLKARWPGLARRVRHSASACADSEFLNGRLAEIQWAGCSDGEGRVLVAGVKALTLSEQRNMLRWWIRKRGFHPPQLSDWRQVMHDLLEAGEDREPELLGEGFSLRRFQGRLYLVPDPVDVARRVATIAPGEKLKWGEWTLGLEPGTNPEQTIPPIRVSTRQGGERLRFSPRESSKSLKNWLQEKAVPPWERARLPLVFAGSEGVGELIAVGDLWCSEQYSGSAPAAGWRLIVERDCD